MALFQLIVKHKWTQVSSAALLACGLITGCDRPSQAAAPGERPPSLVTLADVEKSDVPVYLDEIGKCVAKEMVEIRPQAAGRILEIKFEDGADVKKDQVLFKLDPAPYEAQLAMAKATRDQNTAQLDLATLDFDRIKKLPETVVSKQDRDVKENAITVAKAQLAASVAQIQIAQLKLDYCTIKCPIDGRAGQRLVDLGNVVLSDMNPPSLLVVQRIDPIYADFTITENDLTVVRQHMADGTLKAEVRLPGDEKPELGELTFLDNSVQDGSGTIRLRATVHNEDHHFWPGQFVRVRLVLYSQKDAPLVPSSALQLGQTGQFVYVVTPSGADLIAEPRPIVPGQQQGDKIVIKEGLKPGERVITTGQMTVMPGGKVREAPPAPAGNSNGNGGPGTASKSTTLPTQPTSTQPTSAQPTSTQPTSAQPAMMKSTGDRGAK